MPIVIEMLGSSMVMSGSGWGSSGSASVSPMKISGMPAMATISPGPAESMVTRSSASVPSSSVSRTFSTVPSFLHHATVWPLRMVPLKMRHRARRPRYGDASRLVTWACSGAPSTYVGAGMVSRMTWNSGSRSGLSGLVPSAGRFSDACPVLAWQ